MRLSKIIAVVTCFSVFIMFNEKNKAKEIDFNPKSKTLLQEIKNETDFVFEETKLLLPCVGIVTSMYGFRESDNPIMSRNHKGIDIGADKGTDILSAHSGVVSKAEWYGNYGKCVIIENEEYTTLYAHCSKILVKEGEKVDKGVKIAEVGMTGNATGYHLHFEVIKDGVNLNPKGVIAW